MRLERVDVDTLCASADKRQFVEEGVLALCSLRKHGTSPPREHYGLYKRAQKRSEWADHLREALGKLPPEVRQEIDAVDAKR